MTISFSIDDVISSLIWLEKSNAPSIFNSYTYAFAKWLYTEYGIPTTCNCLYSNGIDNLSMVSDRFKSGFEMCSEWLKFSFHGWNYEKSYAYADYEEALNDKKIVDSEIVRICGEPSLSQTIRTHFYSGSVMALKAWMDTGTEVFLTADDDRFGQGINYGLNKEEISELRKKHSIQKQKVQFEHTDIRLEDYIRNQNWAFNRELDRLVVFTHERFINEKWIKPTFKDLLEEII